MVEFRFDIKSLFPQPIIKVTSNLLPHTFRGDRRQCLDATSKMSEIIDRLGQLSATSQGLNKPVTTAQRLRMSENQTLYLLADRNAGHNGAVTGLLKVGTKDLYLFDETGKTRKIEQSPSILDFYVHETRQRAGLGKRLFETMLSEEQWTPVKCSVDRPSEKLLAFLGKHYGLVRTIPQANNFVLYEGFFDDDGEELNNSRSPQHSNGGLHITNSHNLKISPNTQLFGATYLGEEANKRGRRNSGGQQQQQVSPNVLLQQITQISPSGRYGARRPTCSMAESRKSPLDALSRSTLRQDPMQKRSGLQDVDESFLNANAFARPSRLRHSGLEGQATTLMPPQQMPGATATPMRSAAGAAEQTQMQSQPVPAAQMSNVPPQSMQQQPMQAQQQPPVAAVASQQQQGYVQQPAAGQPSRRDQMPVSNAQPQQAAYEQQQQQQQQQQYQDSTQAQPAAQTSSQPQQQQAQQPITPRKQQQPPPQQAYPPQAPAGYIIHAGSSNAGKGGGSAESSSGNHEVDIIAAQLQQLQTSSNNNHGSHDMLSEPEMEPEPEAEYEPEPELVLPATPPTPPIKSHTPTPPEVRTLETAESIIGEQRRMPAFQLSKQHTGMKNRSFGVGMAVMPSSKMEFNQLEREDFGVVKINRPIGNAGSPVQDNTDAMSTVSSMAGLTDQGYNDLKFYHNKLW